MAKKEEKKIDSSLTRDVKPESCPVTFTMERIGGKWKPVILFLILKGCNRFGALQKAIEGVSKQMLTKQLRELEGDGILDRIIYAEIPPRVEYKITKVGHSLLPIIDAMKVWGEANRKNN